MKKLYTLALCCALLVLAACSENLFGSSSASNDCGEDIKCLRLDAENAFRRSDGSAAYKACSTIVAIDPMASYGYFGMAKATLLKFKVNPLSIFSIAAPACSPTDIDSIKICPCPFLGKDIDERDRYYRAMLRVDTILSVLSRRDSLTDLYECYKVKDSYNENRLGKCITRHVREKDRPGNFLTDPLNLKNLTDTLSKFAKDYNCSDTTCTITITKELEPFHLKSHGKKVSFPLSDREYKYGYFGITLKLSSMSIDFLKNFDNSPYPDGDSTITKDDIPLDKVLVCKEINGIMKFDYNKDEIFKVLEERLNEYYNNVAICEKTANPEKCYEDVANDTPDDINIFNGKIDSLETNLNGILDMLNNLGIEDTTIIEDLDEYRPYSSFYKIGMHVDLDGDGCIDEELLDGLDNDGDGLINENTRIASTDKDSLRLFGVNPMNNSMWGDGNKFSIYKNDYNWEYNKPVVLDPDSPGYIPICNDSRYSNCPELPKDSITGKVTVLRFTQLGYPDGTRYWTTGNRDLKLEVAKDTTCIKYNLDYRIKNIGGCWPYYDENKFKTYYCRSR